MKELFRTSTLAFALASLGALTMTAGCGSNGGAGGALASHESVGRASSAYGTYDLRSIVSDSLRHDSRGWEIEWQIPQLQNPTASGAIGQWYYNFESGIYHTGDGWFVYFYGDDNGLAGDDPNCDGQWGSGGICHGIYSNLQPGQRILFHYEYCTTSHVASVDGTQLCLYVDLHDGAGLRFLAEDDRTTDEMYTHDIEDWIDDGYEIPSIPCSAPTKMVRQRRWTSAGAWVDMTSASSWALETSTSNYHYQNINLAASPSTWESCSGAGPDASCTDGVWNGSETGVDCGGSCGACAGACRMDDLPRVSATASSLETPAFPASQAIDGNAGTRWSSAFSDPQWIYVDLGASRLVREVILDWETAASADFDVQVATSTRGPWTNFAQHQVAVGGGESVVTGPATVGRYVRMYSHARTTQWGNSLWEMRVLGDTNTACVP